MCVHSSPDNHKKNNKNSKMLVKCIVNILLYTCTATQLLKCTCVIIMLKKFTQLSLKHFQNYSEKKQTTDWLIPRQNKNTFTHTRRSNTAI